MKKFSKILSVALLVALVLSLGITNAFAAAPTTGSITVNPNFKDQTYTLYKLFDAQITFDDDGNRQAITYTLPDGKTEEDLVYTDDEGNTHQWFKLDDGFVVVFGDTVGENWAKDKNAIAWAESFGTQVGEPLTAASDNDSNVKWNGLGFGYYYVKTTMGSFIGIDSAAADVTIQDKNQKPPIDKSITGVKDPAGNDDGPVFDATAAEEKTDPGEGANEQAIAQIGDTISYKLEITVKPGALNYVISDNMTHLALVASSVKVDGDLYSDSTKVDATKTTVTDGGSTFTITLDQDWLDNVTEDTPVTVTYDAILTADAAVADAANPNTAKLTWGNNPEKNYSEDSAKVWTAKISVFKEDGNKQPLANAGFVLTKTVTVADTSEDAEAGATKDKTLYYKLVDGKVTWVESIDEADEHFSDAAGVVVPFTGLTTGTYVLVEKTVPDGYNKTDIDSFTIVNDNVTADNLAKSATVINNAGSLLPSTGGIGTTIFYVVGGVLVLAAIILLVTKKRMSE